VNKPKTTGQGLMFQYRFGDSHQMRLVRVLSSVVMVRIGGGWQALEEFLTKNDPCRAKGRTNVEIHEKMILPAGASQSMTPFRRSRRPTTAPESNNNNYGRTSMTSPRQNGNHNRSTVTSPPIPRPSFTSPRVSTTASPRNSPGTNGAGNLRATVSAGSSPITPSSRLVQPKARKTRQSLGTTASPQQNSWRR